MVFTLSLQMEERVGRQKRKHPFNESATVCTESRHFKRSPLIWIKQEKVGTLYIYKALKGINPIICSIFNGHKVKNFKGSTLETAQSILSILFLTFKSQGTIAILTAALITLVLWFSGNDPWICVSLHRWKSVLSPLPYLLAPRNSYGILGIVLSFSLVFFQFLIVGSWYER